MPRVTRKVGGTTESHRNLHLPGQYPGTFIWCPLGEGHRTRPGLDLHLPCAWGQVYLLWDCFSVWKHLCLGAAQRIPRNPERIKSVEEVGLTSEPRGAVPGEHSSPCSPAGVPSRMVPAQQAQRGGLLPHGLQHHHALSPAQGTVPASLPSPHPAPNPPSLPPPAGRECQP